MSLNRTLANLINTDGDVKAANLDLAASITVVEALDSLPTSNLTAGDQAYVKGTSRFYVSNGAGWYNAALVNATPSLSIDPSGAISLATDGSTTTITLTATDSDYPDAALTYTVESDGSFGGLATLSQDSSVFTITPLSEDSATTTSAVLTFKASDAISFGSGDRTLTLEFKVANSNYTTLMLKADTAGTDNQVDASTNNYTITENGNVKSTAFTPYHPGGYSNYITSSGSGYVEWTSPPTFSATAWCVETWFKPDGMPSVAVGNTGHWSIFGCWTANTNNKEFLLIGGSSGEIRFYYSFDGSAASFVDTASGVFSDNTWVHLALSFDGTNYTLYADGVNVARVANSTQIANTSSPLSFGKSIDGGGVTQTYVTGWYADGRVINGSTLESNNTFPVPTSRIDYSVANTQALMHHLPHTRQTVTYNGDATIKRAGPYDYIGYAKADHGGSVYHDGNGDYINIAGSNLYSVGSVSGEAFTIEFWFNYSAVGSNGNGLITKGTSGSTGSGDILTMDLNPSTRVISCTLDGTYSGYELVGNTVLKENVWYHIALVKNTSNVYKLYINGAQETATYTATGTISASTNFYVGTNYYAVSDAARQPTAYFSDVRVVSDAVYTSNFAAPTAPLTAITNTELLTCTNQNDIWDAATGKVLSKLGNVTASTTQRQFTSSSAIYFDGTGDYLISPSFPDFRTSDFTVETWVRFSTLSSIQILLSRYDTGATNNGSWYLQWVPNYVRWGYESSTLNLDSPTQSLSTNTWYHFAVARSGTTLRMFINGNLVASTTDTLDYNYNTDLYLGKLNHPTVPQYLNGYMQDSRITAGLARYTANFTPPTAEFSG